MAYVTEGSGTHRLLFIHGLCGNKDIWSKQRQFFKKFFEVVSIDLLSHGESSIVPGREVISHSSQIVAQFLSHHPKPTTVIGHSLGGFNVNDLIATSGLAEQFVFVDSPAIVSDEKLKLYQSYEEQISSALDPRQFLFDWFGGFMTAESDPADSELVVGEASRHDALRVAAILGSVPPTPSHAIDQNRVFVMEGTQFFGEDRSWSWLKVYPNASAWLYPKMGHFFFMDEPEEFNWQLQEFLTSRASFPGV